MEQTQKFPTEVVDLPSKGKLYPPDSPLACGTIEMKYMTAKEEDILTNQNYIEKGIVIDKLLQALIVDKTIDYSQILIGDKNALPLASGDVNSFLGFNFVVSNRLPIASSKRGCIAYVQDGIALAVGKDSTARIDERADKGYATQVYYSAAFGATRMEEDKVVKIEAHEA